MALLVSGGGAYDGKGNERQPLSGTSQLGIIRSALFNISAAVGFASAEMKDATRAGPRINCPRAEA